MKRTTIYLTDDQKQELELLSARMTRTESDLIREGVDCVLGSRHGQTEQLALLAEIPAGAYELAAFDRADVEAAAEVMSRYGDLRVGLADASIVVLAHKHATADVLSLDQRRFRAMRGPGGRPFRLLPDDLPA